MALMSGGTPDINMNTPKHQQYSPCAFVRPSGPASTRRRSASRQHIALNTIMASKRAQHQSQCLTLGRLWRAKRLLRGRPKPIEPPLTSPINTGNLWWMV
jgi:hypothetical protein